MYIDLNPITKKISQLPTPVIIGISGFGGSGKSTFATFLSKALDAPIIGVDSFCTSNLHQGHTFWDIMDYSRLENEVLIPCLQGEISLTYGVYGLDKDESLTGVQIEHTGIVIVEGVGLFRPELRKYFSLSIWIDCPIEEAIERGEKRDKELYGNPQNFLWEGVWKEQDLECFENYQPKKYVDFVLDHSKVGEWSFLP